MKKVALIATTLLVATACSASPSAPSRGKDAKAPTAKHMRSLTVNADLTEWSIKIAKNPVPAGKITFHVTNTGKADHEFDIEDMPTKTELSLKPGETKDLTVDLKPGTYDVVCDLPGHEELGMKTKLVVQ